MNIEKLAYIFFMFAIFIIVVPKSIVIYNEQINVLDYCIENGYKSSVNLNKDYFYCTKIVKLNDSIGYEIQESGLIPFKDLYRGRK